MSSAYKGHRHYGGHRVGVSQPPEPVHPTGRRPDGGPILAPPPTKGGAGREALLAKRDQLKDAGR